MTIPSDAFREAYTGNNTTDTYAYGWRIYAKTQLSVTLVEVADETNETPLVVDVDYTVTGVNNPSGGNIILTAGNLTSDYKLVIIPNFPFQQDVDLTNQSSVPPERAEEMGDKLSGQLKQVKEKLDRAVTVPVGSTVTPENYLAEMTDLLEDTVQAKDDAEQARDDILNDAGFIAVSGDLLGSDTIGTVAGIAANVTTVAGIHANVTTVAGIAANVTTVAGISANVTAVAGNSTNINAVAGNATNINAVNANKANIDAVAGNATNINTVATNISAVGTCATNIAAIIAAPTEASNAASSASIALAAQVAAQAAASAVANMWNFDTSTSMADPGSTDIRFNNATLSSVTAIAVSANSGDTGNPDVSGYIVTWDDSTHTPKGLLNIRTADGDIAIFGITGSITDNGAWLQIPVSYIAGTASLASGEDVYVSFSGYGNDGTGTGDVLASGTPTNGQVAIWTTATTIKGVTVSGDITIDSSGVAAIGSGVIVNADINASAAIALTKLATQGANTFLANATTGSATPTAIALSASQLAGRGASGNVAAITLGTNLSMSGTTLNAAGGISNYGLIQNQQTSGTNGPAYSGGSWEDVPLNTEVLDQGGFISISGNAFTLSQAGTYAILASHSARSSASANRNWRSRIYNTSDSALVAEGASQVMTAGGGGGGGNSVQGIVTIASSKTFKIQIHGSGSLTATDAASTGSPEVYASVMIIKLS